MYCVCGLALFRYGRVKPFLLQIVEFVHLALFALGWRRNKVGFVLTEYAVADL